MSYIRPGEVESPKSRWRLHLVLYDGGEDNWSAAEGQWEHDGRWDTVLAIRWNGKDGDRLGNPQSRGRPIWFIVPEELEPAIRAVISNRRDRTGESPPGDGPRELPTGSGAAAAMKEPVAVAQEAAVQEWVAWDIRDSRNHEPHRITESHENRQECIADAKRELNVIPRGELPPYIRIKHAGEVDDCTLFDEWKARRGHLQQCPICGPEPEREYHLDGNRVVLYCQRCKRETLLSVDWRDEAGLP